MADNKKNDLFRLPKFPKKFTQQNDLRIRIRLADRLYHELKGGGIIVGEKQKSELFTSESLLKNWCQTYVFPDSPTVNAREGTADPML